MARPILKSESEIRVDTLMHHEARALMERRFGRIVLSAISAYLSVGLSSCATSGVRAGMRLYEVNAELDSAPVQVLTIEDSCGEEHPVFLYPWVRDNSSSRGCAAMGQALQGGPVDPAMVPEYQRWQAGHYYVVTDVNGEKVLEVRKYKNGFRAEAGFRNRPIECTADE